MAVLPIRLYPDPVLREECAAVEAFDDGLRALVADMIETMHDAPGVGLAAPQVGIPRRIAVVDTSVGKDPAALRVLVNPRIVGETEEHEVDWEGCLSIPDLSERVSRPVGVRVVASDVDGAEQEIEAADFEARAIFHEIDHLDGVLFVDHLRGLRRDKARRALRRLVREAETAG